MVELYFEQLPALWPKYLRALVSGRSASRLSNIAIPEIRASAEGFNADLRQLSRFRELLNHPNDGLLPATFPQLLAAPLHLSLLTAREFPLRASGLVHMSNNIQYLEPVHQDETLELAAVVSGQYVADQGVELLLKTTASVAGKPRWRASSQLRARLAGHRQGRIRSRPPRVKESTTVSRWQADSNIGRRYASVSGDYNPIHLHGITARLFGFKRAIAHGMWTLGRSIAELHAQLKPPFSIDAQFLRPVLLPAELELLLENDNQASFSVVDSNTKKAYLTGQLT